LKKQLDFFRILADGGGRFAGTFTVEGSNVFRDGKRCMNSDEGG